jgi:hypothetical protein
MKSFKSHLIENQLYDPTDPAEKTKFTSNPKMVYQAFVFSFLGTLGLLNAAANNRLGQLTLLMRVSFVDG